MKRDNPNSVYVLMMLDSLKRKSIIMKKIFELTTGQETLLKSKELDEDKFDQYVDEKGKLIDEINEMDEGFDSLFKRVKIEVVNNRDEYEAEIKEMQKYISELSDLSVSIQTLEHQNEDHFKVYLADSRRVIKDFNVNNRTATAYFNNMSNAYKPGNSYFFNEKK